MMYRKRFKTGLVLVTLITIAAVFSVFYTPCDPYVMDQTSRYQPPSGEHWFGTDNFGRDIFSRVMKGVGVSLFFALVTLIASFCAGTALGLCAAVSGGILDRVIMRLINALNSIPVVLFALVLRSVLPDGNLPLTAVMTIIFIPSFVRVSRNEAMLAKEFEYVQFARILGASWLRIVLVYILPNIKAPLLSTVIIVLTRSILIESTLSYLGVGVQPPVPSLGRMMFDAQSYLFNAPWAALLTGGVMVLMICSMNYLGEGLQHD